VIRRALAAAALAAVATFVHAPRSHAQTPRRAVHAASAPAWPAITATTRPWTRWWWQGSEVDSAGLTAALRSYRAVGLGGVELTPIYGVRGEERQFIPYLSPRWVGMLEHTLTQARRLGLGVDMATGTGWPFGGPNVGDEDASKYVAWKTYTLTGGERRRDSIFMMQQPLVRAVSGRVDVAQLRDPIASTPNLQALAIDQVRFPKPMSIAALVAYSKAGAVQDLTARVSPSGVLDWTAFEGDWTLYAVFQGWHGKQVERAAPGGEGNVIDHFAKEPIAHYLDRFDRAFARRRVSGIRAFFNDSYEVDDASGQGDWTPRMFDEFEARRGYDLRAHLPALFGAIDSDSARRVLSDYRETVSDLMLDGFTKTWADWAHRRRTVVRDQAHGSPANILDLYAAVDIPETEGTDATRIRFATSAAHVAGKPLASAEAATWLTEHFVTTLSDVRAALDDYYVNGVNNIVYHGTAYSPASEPWPGRLFYAAVEFDPQNPWWRDFSELNAYATATQSFLQSGAPDNDVLLYWPIHDRFAQRARTGALLEHFDAIPPNDSSAFRVAADAMLEDGWQYDYASDRQLAAARAENGAVVTSGNARYRVVLVPASRFMPAETMQQLEALARAGATIAFLGALPADVPGLGDLGVRRTRFLAAKSALELAAPARASEVARKQLGAGTVLLGSDVDALLAASGARREPAVDMGVKLARRRERDGAVYFIANTSGKSVDGWVPLATNARSAAVYASMHRTSGMGRIRATPSGIEVYLQFPAGASRIVRTYDHDVAAAPWRYTETAGAAVPVTDSWTLDFVSGGPTLPATVHDAPLGSWTDLPGDDVKRFSGTARYTVTFPRPTLPGGATSWRLDLGKVHESARVVLNGKSLGTFIGPWWRVEVPASALRDTNELVVLASNLMANRIADLDRRGVPWKKFYNVNFPPRLAANRGPDGLFSAAKWTPLPSGLVGPVTLTPLRAKTF
jgi:hypothetical protein